MSDRRSDAKSLGYANSASSAGSTNGMLTSVDAVATSFQTERKLSSDTMWLIAGSLFLVASLGRLLFGLQLFRRENLNLVKRRL